MNVVRKPSDLVADARAILAQARREMSDTLSPRLRKQIEDRATQRVEKLLILAEAPGHLRNARWEQRRGRRPSLARYRVELS